MRLILASASPRRADLLTQAGYQFEVAAADIDERRLPGESPATYVRRLAIEKSAAAASRLPESGRPDGPAILAADTTVVVDGAVLGKPDDEAEATGMLRRLSGRSHEVLTGVSLRRGGVEVGAVARTVVWFARLSRSDLAWYVATGEGRDKAGAYAIQGLASRYIERIEGSYSNVVGLPVAVVHRMLGELAGEPGGDD